MSHSRQTEHYELPLYDGTDIINPLTDFNNANSAIDEALYNANQRSVGAETTANEAKDIAEGYDTRVSLAIETADDAMALANNTQDMIADDFDPNKAGGYNVGDFVIYNGKLYRFINAHTGAWDASDVQVSPVLIEAIADVVDEGKQDIADAVADAEQEIAGQTEKVTKTQAMIAQPFDENKSGGYSVGDIVTYADKLYKFTSAHSGAWTGLDVEQVDVIDELMPNVIKIELDSTATWYTVLNSIIASLTSLGITDFLSIKDCIIKQSVGSSDFNVYRLQHLTQSMIRLNSTVSTITERYYKTVFYVLEMSSNNSTAFRCDTGATGTTPDAPIYTDYTNRVVSSSGYVEFEWR